jgi:hypothetical protein
MWRRSRSVAVGIGRAAEPRSPARAGGAAERDVEQAYRADPGLAQDAASRLPFHCLVRQAVAVGPAPGYTLDKPTDANGSPTMVQ